uniref:Uncharacterized protein n=1 Tax=Aegilops tauschii subsp. strangulata TaxID=200361 RepID=A0A452ZXR3_AEGTS
MSNKFTFHLASTIIQVFSCLLVVLARWFCFFTVSNIVCFYDFSLVKHIHFHALFSIVVHNSMAAYYQLQKLFICH